MGTAKRTPHQYSVMSATFDHSTIPMFWLRGSKIFMFNASFAQLSGYAEEELIGLNFSDLHHEDNEATHLEEIHSHDRERDPRIFTWIMRTKQGGSEPVELRLTRFYLDDDPIPYYYGVSRKFSLIEESTQVFASAGQSIKLALEAAGQGMFEYNATTKAFLFSQELFDLLGYSGTESDFQAIWNGSLHPEDQKRLRDRWEAFLRGKIHHASFKFRMRNKQGEYIRMFSRCMILAHRSDGHALRVAGVIRSVNTDYEYLETIESQAQKLIDYAYINSHHLRGPLSSILGLVELLREDCSAETVMQLKSAAEELDRVVHRINNTLTGNLPKSPKTAPVSKVQ